MGLDQPGFWLIVFEIIWINILLSGDNAVVIAMACRGLHGRRRTWGIALGAGVAILLRIIFTGIVTTLMAIPFLKIVGALALFWIAMKLVVPESDEGDEGDATQSLWRAVRMIAIADVVMSLDNVIAIAAVARGSWTLLILGLLISIPLIIAGSALLTAVLERFPILVWAGSALLGWIAGELLVSDPVLHGVIPAHLERPVELAAAVLGALVAIGGGYLMRRRAQASEARSTSRAPVPSPPA